MRYKPELGFFGNLERAYAELTKTNNNIFNNKSEVDARFYEISSTQNDTDAILVDQEYRLALMELGI